MLHGTHACHNVQNYSSCHVDLYDQQAQLCGFLIVLVHLDVDVDVSDEFERGEECDGTKHQEKHITSEDRVAEELDRL